FLLSSSFLFLLTPRTPRSTLFPYTTLFRSRDNRSFFYPSVSASFVFTEIEGLQSDVLNFGKLRASYAEVGQAGNYYDSFYSVPRSEEHTSELQSRENLVCRLLLEKKKKNKT